MNKSGMKKKLWFTSNVFSVLITAALMLSGSVLLYGGENEYRRLKTNLHYSQNPVYLGQYKGELKKVPKYFTLHLPERGITKEQKMEADKVSKRAKKEIRKWIEYYLREKFVPERFMQFTEFIRNSYKGEEKERYDHQAWTKYITPNGIHFQIGQNSSAIIFIIKTSFSLRGNPNQPKIQAYVNTVFNTYFEKSAYVDLDKIFSGWFNASRIDKKKEWRPSPREKYFRTTDYGKKLRASPFYELRIWTNGTSTLFILPKKKVFRLAGTSKSIGFFKKHRGDQWFHITSDSKNQLIPAYTLPGVAGGSFHGSSFRQSLDFNMIKKNFKKSSPYKRKD